MTFAEFFTRPLNWVTDRRRPTQFATNKNTPGIDYASKPGAPVHHNHRQRLVKFIDDLPTFNIKGCESGRIQCDKPNFEDIPREEKPRQTVLLIDDGLTFTD